MTIRKAIRERSGRDVACMPDRLVVDAEQLVVGLVGDDLHEAARLAQDRGLAGGGEGHGADLDLVAPVGGLRRGEL